jgi:hypothetical protein
MQSSRRGRPKKTESKFHHKDTKDTEDRKSHTRRVGEWAKCAWWRMGDFEALRASNCRHVLREILSV